MSNDNTVGPITTKLDRLKAFGEILVESSPRKPTEIECLMVSCPICQAVRNEPCTAFHLISTTHKTFMHRDRVELAQYRVNSLASVDKSVVMQYAFLLMSDSVSANSAQIMGKTFPPDTVQKFFIGRAILELRELGAIK